MAQAYSKNFSQVEYDASLGKDRATFEIVFTGPEIPSGYDVAYGEVLLDPGDPVSQMRSKVTQVILLEASVRGYVVAKQDMAIPVLQQGV